MGIGWDGWKEASDVQEPREFFRFEEERDGHRGVIVRPQGKYARDGYRRSRNDDRQREGTEDGGLRGLSICWVTWTNERLLDFVPCMTI